MREPANSFDKAGTQTVVLGLGNPILMDDRVGLVVAREVKALLQQKGFDNIVHVKELYTSGLALLEELTGYRQAVIVDALTTGKVKPGTVSSFDVNEIEKSMHYFSLHGMDIISVLELGKSLNINLPSSIQIWGIEADDVKTFSEELTSDVEKAVPIVVRDIFEYVIQKQGRCEN